MNNVSFSQNCVTFFRLLELNLDFLKFRSIMKRQTQSTFLPDGQILNYSSTESDKDQKVNEIDEEMEFKFFNSGKDDYNDLRNRRLRMKN